VATLVHGDTDDLILILSKIKVERLLPRGRKVITTTTSELIPEVFKKMVDTNVLSLPVLNLKEKYFGVVEMFDLVEYVTTLFADLATTKFIDLEKMLVSERSFVDATVRDVMKRPISKRNPFKPIEKGFSLFTAWEILSLSTTHRVPILDEKGDICDLITQSMLIDFLWQNIEKIGALADHQVKDLKSKASETLGVVKASTRAITAFMDMVGNDNGGLAIVDDNGRLIENLSVRDLRGIHPNATVFWRLWSAVLEYKSKVRQDYPDKTPTELIYALPNDSFYSVVEKMAKMHVHRIYVVDSKESMKPTRVITQTDILREVIYK